LGPPKKPAWSGARLLARRPENDLSISRIAMSYAIVASCADPVSDDFTGRFDSVGIDYEVFDRQPAIACASADEIFDIGENVATYPAVIGTFIVWLKARMESAGPELRGDDLLP
jgi:hypothetical protein